MRDERVAPKGWPPAQRHRRSKKVGDAHAEWVRRTSHQAEFHPHGRKDGSDYSLHYVDLDAPLAAIIDFDRRTREIDGRDPDTGRRLPEPTPEERFQGAMLGTVIGEAFGRAVDSGATAQLSWPLSASLRNDQALTEHVLPEGATIESGAVTHLLAFTLDGLIRAHVAHRTDTGTDPASAVQHAYQRWLFTQPRDGQRRTWPGCAGPDAANTEPDGWLLDVPGLHHDAGADAGTVATLEDFARTGRRSTLRELRGQARGSDVVPRAAAAAVCSNDPAEVFAAAISIAALTHSSQHDCLAAGTLAVILHQQVRDQPFYDCLTTAREHLERWPGHERVARNIELARAMTRDYWVPASREDVRTPFGDGGADGAEALGLALYCAMASDYVREGVQLAANYSAHRPVVAAITGMILGAECGLRVIPDDLRAAAPLAEVIDALGADALAEFGDHPPHDDAWLHRYPAS